MTEKILPVSFTDEAMEQVRKIIQAKNIPTEYGLRVGVSGAGCAGVSYLLGFDKKKEKDDVFIVEGLEIYIEKKALLYLAGQMIDFHQGDQTSGFFFTPEK